MRSDLPNIDTMPDSALITADEFAGLLKVSVGTIWRWSTDGVIAKPIRIGNNCTRWRVSDARAALNPAPIGPRQSPNQIAQKAAA